MWVRGARVLEVEHAEDNTYYSYTYYDYYTYYTILTTAYSRSSMPRTMNWPMLADDMNMTITVEVAEETCMCTWRGMCMRVHGASIAWT